MKVTFFLMWLLLVPQASGQQQVVEVPFDFVRNEIIVQVKVDGKGPFNMMLDTGTDPSAIDLATAKELGLKLSSVGGPVSGGGTDKNLAYATKLPLVEAGGLTVKNILALAIDLSKVGVGRTNFVLAQMSDEQPRVDALVLAGIRELGSSEAAMIDKVCSRIENNPRAAHVTMEFLRLYQQLRFMYKQGGIWDPEVAKAELPFQHSRVRAVLAS